MKKYISIFLCAVLAIAACKPVSPEESEAEVYQGTKAGVELSSDEAIPAEGGKLVATVHRSPEFTVSIPKTAEQWLSCSQADSVVTFTAAANNSAVLRYARVSIIDKELKISVTSFDVMQAGTEKDVAPVVYKTFSAGPERISVAASATSAEVNVDADETVEWTVTSDNAAFVPAPASGKGTSTVTVSFPANTASEAVSAVITVSTTDEGVLNKTFKITINQNGSAGGIVLAEWEFETAQINALKAGGIEGVTAEEDNAVGNGGNPYVPSNISGKGKLEYFNGTDKSSVSTKKPKRRIGERGEFCVYCSWEGDYILWTAEPDAPLAAGTKIQINFALRPSHEDTPKYWKCEVLDGDKWVELSTISLDFRKDAAGTAEDPKQINCFIKESHTLTSETPLAQFKFTCTKNARCFDDAPVAAFTSKYVLRFAGKWLEASEDNKYLQVPENPKIMVIE